MDFITLTKRINHLIFLVVQKEITEAGKFERACGLKALASDKWIGCFKRSGVYEINSTPYNLVEGGIECVEKNPCLQAIQGKYLICRLLLPVHHPKGSLI